MRRSVIYHAGPTNSGKTYNALAALKEAWSGVYCGPLRLLALEVYESLNLDGTPDADEYVPDGKPNLLDDYEYGMCGKVFKYEYLSDKRVAAVASFGGLLLLVQGEQRHLVRIQLDQKVYCLMRKSS